MTIVEKVRPTKNISKVL